MVKKTKAKKDLITPFVNAIRNENLKVGLYYSLLDWSHPEYPNFLRDKKRYDKDELRWKKFTKFNFGQIEELTAFNPDLYWFDGDWEQTAEMWKAKEIRQLLLEKNTHNPLLILGYRDMVIMQLLSKVFLLQDHKTITGNCV